MRHHLVYYLFDPAGTELLYIGRTVRLAERVRYFKKRTGIEPMVGFCQRHKTIESACEAELVAIRKHQPPFNRHLVSSRGCYGMTLPTKGQPKSEETRRRMSKPKSAETRMKMSKPKSPEHRAKLRASIDLINARRRQEQQN